MSRSCRPWIFSLGFLFVLHACQTVASPHEPAFHPSKLAEIDATILQAITNGRLPGAVFHLDRGPDSYQRAFGRRSLTPSEESATPDTIYDAASLTKVLATTPALMLLVERGQVRLDDPLKKHLPEFTGANRDAITICHLLTHTSGLRPGLGAQAPWSGYERAIQLACAEKPLTAPGAAFRYSDINFILLGEIIQRITGQKLPDFVDSQIYQPLKMNDTGFLPSAAKLNRIAPTEYASQTMLRGTVHDPTARRMGGIAGHAGLFTTATDLARYARMLLNGGTLDGVRLFDSATVRLMTSVQTPPAMEIRRGLGWDIDSGYSRPRGRHFPLGSFGHTGWTGTCLWIDPFSQTFWLLLSNRVHPDGKGNILELQSVLGTLTAESVIGFNFAFVPGALPPRKTAETKLPTTRSAGIITNVSVLNGIDVLVKKNFAPLKGLRIGLVTNHSGQDRQRNETIALLKNAPGVSLLALFCPEHGIRGDRDEKMPDTIDAQTGLPIYSLYGETVQPRSEQLNGLDALVFDVQDIGCRFYTYISTLGQCLAAAGKARLKFFVLDRVNPINGLAIEGPVLTAPLSFTACHPIPVRHGMTIGELARMFNQEQALQADLVVIPLEGWTRDLWFDQTELPWTNPSPNMRSLTQATLYPGVGLLETTELSVGRGTGTPFELVGAPYINDLQLAKELNRIGLEGARFVPVRFTPTASVFKDKNCAGVAIILTDREHCCAVDIGIVIAKTLHRLYPEKFTLRKFNVLLGHDQTIQDIQSGKSLAQIKQAWSGCLEEFQRHRAPFLLY